MAERLAVDTPFERMDPEQVSDHDFAVTRKGFDKGQVQAYLVSVANQIKAGQQQIRELREQVAEAEDEPESESEFSSEGIKLLDSDVDASRRQTQTEAGEMVASARRLAEQIQTTVADLRSQQETSGAEELAELLEQAYEQAQAVDGLFQKVRDQATAEVEHGRDQGKEILQQAKALRLTVLRDMAQRRQAARAQVERLRAGRDKLIAILSEARSSIDQSVDSAKLSLAEAKILADAAARRVEDEGQPTDLALLSELDDAENVGMIPEPHSAPEPSAPGEGGEMIAGAGVQEGVAFLPPAGRDPVEAAADHPAMIGADGSHDVDAIFSRLRSQSGRPQEDRETAPDAAEASVGKD